MKFLPAATFLYFLTHNCEVLGAFCNWGPDGTGTWYVFHLGGRGTGALSTGRRMVQRRLPQRNPWQLLAQLPLRFLLQAVSATGAQTFLVRLPSAREAYRAAETGATLVETTVSPVAAAAGATVVVAIQVLGIAADARPGGLRRRGHITLLTLHAAQTALSTTRLLLRRNESFTAHM
jgi:hypothetical protein